MNEGSPMKVICPLCKEEILPEDRVYDIWINEKHTPLHTHCVKELVEHHLITGFAAGKAGEGPPFDR